MKITKNYLRTLIRESLDEVDGQLEEAAGTKVYTVTKDGVLLGIYMDKPAALAAGKKAGALVKVVTAGIELRQVGAGSGDVIYTPERY